MCLEKVFASVLFYPLNVRKGTATRDDIDTTLKLGMNHPMGPLQLGKYSISYRFLILMLS